MTKIEAERYVYRILAHTLEADIANGSDWMRSNLLESDQNRVHEATKKIVAELREKAKP